MPKMKTNAALKEVILITCHITCPSKKIQIIEILRDYVGNPVAKNNNNCPASLCAAFACFVTLITVAIMILWARFDLHTV